MTPVTLPPTILVIVGMRGDLSRRKLIPALVRMAQRGALPEHFHLIGTSRSVGTLDQYEDIPGFGLLAPHTTLIQMECPDDATVLRQTIEHLERGWGRASERLFYFSVPSLAAKPLIDLLHDAGLLASPTAKLLLEKPFGNDSLSARALMHTLEAMVADDQVYCIDHYLFKDIARLMPSFRSAATLEGAWEPSAIDHIEIIASETLGVGHRGEFYDATGALRDVVQSHLLELAALTVMPLDGEVSLATRRLEALRHFSVARGSTLRGQYRGYSEETGIRGSNTETFIAARIVSDDGVYRGAPLTLVTGKKLDRKYTEVRVYYSSSGGTAPRVLRLVYDPAPRITIETPEGILVQEYPLETSVMMEAYEALFAHAFVSQRDHFVSFAEIVELWRITEVIQRDGVSSPLIDYPPDSTLEALVPSAA